MPDRILVVDDEEAIREIVCAILAAHGYTWKQASSGMEALALLNSGEVFELMLSDLMMADLDGIGLLERTKEKFPDMPVVMVTAVHDISVALAAIRNGAYDYLLKPFEREQLLNAVGRALENRRLKVENRTYQTNLESLVQARTDQLQAAMEDLERSYDITLQALGDALDLKDAEERAIMREHCYHGYQMLKKIPFLAEACDIVYSHQEHFNGSGYPRGLKGGEIPLGARIFSVADTLDAIISDRPYRPARTLTEARTEIKAWTGRQFDPEVVEVFSKMPDEIFEDLRREINAQSYPFSYSASAKGS